MAESKKSAFVSRLAGRRKNVGPAPHEIEGPGPPPRPVEGIAVVLRRAREEQGRDLARVAGDLKIRKVYLTAIEEGRFDDLPGATYAVGFVRAYADYLRLDGEEIIRRFKDEVEGLNEHLQLVFPTPSPESKIPGRALLLISALLIALAYGGWYTLSSDGVNLADWVPEVPERLRSLTSLGSSEAPAEVEPAEVDPAKVEPAEVDPAEVDPAEVEPALLPEVSASPEITAQPALSEEATESPAPEPPVEEPVEETAAAVTSEITEPAPPALASAGEAETGEVETGEAEAGGLASSAVLPSPDAAPAEAAFAEAAPPEAAAATAPLAEGTAEPAAIDLAATEIPQAPLPEGPLPEARAREPRVFGAENISARIVLRAVLDSWVQVRDPEDSLLLTRVLQPGDTYRVPNQPGLTLLTGNAGGLRIEIDGITLPPLGPVGSVRRNVPLNPDRMLNEAASSR